MELYTVFMFVDAHAHITHENIADREEEFLQRAAQHHIVAIVNVCTDSESLAKGLALTERHRWVFNAAAVTPHDVETLGETFFSEVAACARERKVVAVGETGLDYHYKELSKELQHKFLLKHLELAKETSLPLIFHCREAFHDLFSMTGGIDSAMLHCFTGSKEEAKGCIDRGWMVSFSGIVTFKNSAALREMAAFVPLESMLIETDAPYLAPQSKRGMVNEPANVTEVAHVIASIKGVTTEDVGNITARNAAKLFGFPKHVVCA